MKTIEKVKETVSCDKIIDIACNKCNKSIYIDDYDMKGTSFDIDFGYGSNKDGCVFRFELCDDCFDELTKSFLTQPDVVDHV